MIQPVDLESDVTFDSVESSLPISPELHQTQETRPIFESANTAVRTLVATALLLYAAESIPAQTETNTTTPDTQVQQLLDKMKDMSPQDKRNFRKSLGIRQPRAPVDVLHGEDEPDKKKGKNGDKYLLILPGKITVYVKEKGEWGEKSTIAPKDGVDGKNGNGWMIGAVAPDNTNGTDGDLYLNSQTCDVFSKNSGKWTMMGNIRGIDAPYWPGIAAGVGSGLFFSGVFAYFLSRKLSSMAITPPARPVRPVTPTTTT